MTHSLRYTLSVVAMTSVVSAATTVAIVRVGAPLNAQMNAACQAAQEEFNAANYEYHWTCRDDKSCRDAAKARYDRASTQLSRDCAGSAAGGAASPRGNPNACNALRTQVENLQELVAKGAIDDRADNNYAYKLAKEELKKCMKENDSGAGAGRGGLAGGMKGAPNMAGKTFSDCSALNLEAIGVYQSAQNGFSSTANQAFVQPQACYRQAAMAAQGLTEAAVKGLCEQLAKKDINQNECDYYNWYQFCSQSAWGGGWSNYYVPNPPPASCTGNSTVPTQGPSGTKLPSRGSAGMGGHQGGLPMVESSTPGDAKPFNPPDAPVGPLNPCNDAAPAGGWQNVPGFPGMPSPMKPGAPQGGMQIPGAGIAPRGAQGQGFGGGMQAPQGMQGQGGGALPAGGVPPMRQPGQAPGRGAPGAGGVAPIRGDAPQGGKRPPNEGFMAPLDGNWEPGVIY